MSFKNSETDQLPLSVLLDMLAFDSTDQETRGVVKKIILRDYVKKPLIRTKKSGQKIKNPSASTKDCAKIITHHQSDST